MGGSLAFIRDQLASHPATQWCHFSIQEFAQGQLLLGVRAKDEGAARLFESAGLLALVVDYGACKLGYENLGCCFVSECEVSAHRGTAANEWLLMLNLEQLAERDASFECLVFARVGSHRLLLAEAQGSLQKKH